MGTRTLGVILALLAALVGGPITASSAADAPSVITFRDPHGDVLRGHDIVKVRVRNGIDAVTIRVWHRDLRRDHTYSFRAFVDSDPATSTPEVKVGGAYPNADYVACTTSWWTFQHGKGCDPEDRARLCRVDFAVHWAHDVTVIRFERTAICLAGSGPVRVDVGSTQSWPKKTHWDYAPGPRVWSRSVPAAGS